MTGSTKAVLLSGGIAMFFLTLRGIGLATENGVIVGLLTSANYLLWLAYYDRQAAQNEGNDQ